MEEVNITIGESIEEIIVTITEVKEEINIVLSQFMDSAINTDEKVKYDADDSTVGYLADKIVAGSGISIAEGLGADENKSIITNSDLGSTAVSAHNIAFNHGNIHALGTDNETANSIIALGIDEIEFAIIKSYMI